MIKVMDLITWAKLNAVECSLKHPTGWIRGDDLERLAKAVKKSEPFDYSPTHRGLHETGANQNVSL